MSNDIESVTAVPEVAFYYPGPMWHSGDWVKNLILFFDGVALLVPEYMKDRPFHLDPAITSGLEEHGLLHIIEPEKVVDGPATERLTEAMFGLITKGAFDDLDRENTAFHELSYSRLGGYGDHEFARIILDELIARGLARETEDGKSIPLHPTVWGVILVLLAQILQTSGGGIGVDLMPVTDQPDLVKALQELLSVPASPSVGHIVSFDLKVVGVDLSSFPIDEVLGFRQDNLLDYRAYARNVRRFVRELSVMGLESRERGSADRQEELNDLAERLRGVASKTWRRPLTFALGMLGAAWKTHSGDLIGASLMAGKELAGVSSGASGDVGAYSYLFRARDAF